MKNVFLALALLLALGSCNSADEKMRTTPSGIQYQIIRGSDSGKKAPMMATAKVAVRNFADTGAVAAQMPLYQMVLPPAPFVSDALAEIMVTVGVREGDSIIVVAKDNNRMAYTIQRVYIPGENGLNTDSLIAVDKSQELHRFIASHAQVSGKRIENYLRKNNITATQTDDNVFIQIIKTGTGARPDSAQKLGIHFTIKNIYTSKIINSNTDSAFHQPPILEYELLKGFMLTPVDRALMQLPKGSKANIYIPAAIALGAKAGEPKADLKSDMVFEVEVVR